MRTSIPKMHDIKLASGTSHIQRDVRRPELLYFLAIEEIECKCKKKGCLQKGPVTLYLKASVP